MKITYAYLLLGLILGYLIPKLFVKVKDLYFKIKYFRLERKIERSK